MLTRLRLRNFKAWEDSDDVRLAPITVLFGANSAGKTSIPQLLLLLKQTAESPDRKRPLHLGDSRTLIDLGTYDDVVRGHDIGQPVGFSLEWKLQQALIIDDPLSDQRFRATAIAFEAELRADERHQPFVQSFSYVVRGDTDSTVQIGMRRIADRKYELICNGYEPVRQPGRVWPLPAPVRCYGFPDEAVAYFQNTAFVSDLVLAMERRLRTLHYVGPLREYPKRLYPWSGELPDHVGDRGDRAVEAILAAGARGFNLRPRGRKQPLAELVAERLRQMGLIASFKVSRLGEHRKEYEVLVQTRQQMPAVKLTDVGFGLSQILPVIVECFYVPPESVVIFEQPEIHLHPKVQADLADLFVDAIHAREEGTDRHCQFIIESHSEHFLRRLQRRVAEEQLSPDEVALYFVHTDNGSARIEELEVDDYGNIRNWPSGFFGDEMADLVARAEAQVKRSESSD